MPGLTSSAVCSNCGLKGTHTKACAISTLEIKADLLRKRLIIIEKEIERLKEV